MKLALLAVIATLVIGGLIAAQMAAGNDPALGPKAVAQAKKASSQARRATAPRATGESRRNRPVHPGLRLRPLLLRGLGVLRRLQAATRSGSRRRLTGTPSG